MWGRRGNWPQEYGFMNIYDSYIHIYIYTHNYMVLELIWSDYRVYEWFWMCMVNISIVNELHKSAKKYSRVISTLSFMDISWYPPPQKKRTTHQTLCLRGFHEPLWMGPSKEHRCRWWLDSQRTGQFHQTNCGLTLFYFIFSSNTAASVRDFRDQKQSGDFPARHMAYGDSLPKNTQEWGQTAALRLHQAEHFNRGRSALD